MNKYDKEFKEGFLEENIDTSLVPVYNTLFNKSGDIESRLDKDVYDFHRQDIDLLYYTISTPSIKTLQVFNSLLIRYTAYAIRNGMRASNLNIYQALDTAELNRYVAEYKQQHLTKTEFDEFMKYVVNDNDVAIYRSLFEGISGARYSEIVNLKYEDIYEEEGQYYAHLTEELANGTKIERTMPITYELYMDFTRAYNQKIYLSENGEAEFQKEVELEDSPFIFRPVRRGAYQQSNGQINMQTIYRKKTVLSELTDGKIKNTNTLVISGMLHEAAQIYKKNSQLTDGDYIKILRKFKKDITTKYDNQRVKHAKDILRKGLEERYQIKI